MRSDATSSINQGTYSCRKLDRRDLKRLPERNSRQLHLPHIFHPVHDRTRFPRKVNASFLQKAKLPEITVIFIYSEAQSHLNKHRVTGIFRSLHEILCSVSPSVRTMDPPVFYQLIARTVKRIIDRNNTCRKPCRHRDDLKCGTRFICIVQTGIPPHLIEQILFFFFTHSISTDICIQCKRLVQVKFRHIDTGINFSVLRIHKQN